MMNYSQVHIRELYNHSLVGPLSIYKAIQIGVRDNPDVVVYKDPWSGCYLLDRNFHANSENLLEKYKSRLGTVDSAENPDNIRRDFMLRSQLKDKKLIDVGCGSGGFLYRVRDVVASAYGLDRFMSIDHGLYMSELRPRNIQLAINITDDSGQFYSEKQRGYLKEFRPDVITMFHVLEHVPRPVTFLMSWVDIMPAGGKLIIEIPHANDWLIGASEKFRRHTFWSEHLVLYTAETLTNLLKACGLTKIKTRYIQRYGLQNHMSWLADEQSAIPIDLKQAESNYAKVLVQNKVTDTLVVSACKSLPDRSQEDLLQSA